MTDRGNDAWLDEREDGGLSCIKCDVELDVKGETYREVLRRTAAALRVAADRISSGKLDTGFHDVTDVDGHKVGEIYLDHYGEFTV